MEKKTIRSLGLVASGIMIATLLLFGGGYNLIYGVFSNTKIGAGKAPVVVSEYVKAMNDGLVSASKAVLPTVVSISVTIEEKESKSRSNDQLKEFFEFFGQPYQDDDSPHRSEGNGSGVIVTSDGYIVTNNHVVKDATSIKVTTYDKKTHKAKLIGTDPYTDLAVIKIETGDLPVAHFADIEEVKTGEMVLAVGNPLGLNSTVTSGIISAIGRGGLALSRDKDGFGVEYFIQTDAAINPGNSGGGLFSLDGSLVGINTAIATRTGTYIGYGFAIPIDLVKSVAEDLIQNGKINRGYIGVTISSVTENIAKSSGLEDVKGAVVNKVIKGKAASKAGIEMGDIILEVDGKNVSTSNELQSIIVTKKAGDVVDITLWRDGQKISKQVKLEPMESDDLANNSEIDSEKGQSYDDSKPYEFTKLGFTVESLKSDDEKTFDVESGAMVSKVKRYSVAESSYLTAGGVIFKADREKITSPSDLRRVINGKKPGDAVMLYVKYKNDSRVVAMEIPE